MYIANGREIQDQYGRELMYYCRNTIGIYIYLRFDIQFRVNEYIIFLAEEYKYGEVVQQSNFCVQYPNLLLFLMGRIVSVKQYIRLIMLDYSFHVLLVGLFFESVMRVDFQEYQIFSLKRILYNKCFFNCCYIRETYDL